MTKLKSGSDQIQYVLFGAFGGWNAGDEAILASVETLLEIPSVSNDDTPDKKADPKFNRIVICARVREGAREVYQRCGRKIVLAKDFGAIAKSLRGRRLVIGGGQMLTGDKSYKGLIFLVILTTIARLVGRRAVMVGIGVEGVHRWSAKRLCRMIVRNCRFVACRDEYSRLMLEQAKCKVDRLSLKADVVLSKAICGKPLPDRDDSNDPLAESKGPTIAIGLHCAPTRSYASIEEMSALVIDLADAFPDHVINVVSNDCRAGFDEEMLTTLESQIQHPRVEFCHFDYADNIVQAYARASCVVSVRMHPLILGLIHGTPVVGIRRSNKVIQLANRVGFPLHDLGNQPIADLVDVIGNVMAQPAPCIDQLSVLADDQFQSVRSESLS